MWDDVATMYHVVFMFHVVSYIFFTPSYLCTCVCYWSSMYCKDTDSAGDISNFPPLLVHSSPLLCVICMYLCMTSHCEELYTVASCSQRTDGVGGLYGFTRRMLSHSRRWWVSCTVILPWPLTGEFRFRKIGKGTIPTICLHWQYNPHDIPLKLIGKLNDEHCERNTSKETRHD